jgi:hypothetical protein
MTSENCAALFCNPVAIIPDKRNEYRFTAKVYLDTGFLCEIEFGITLQI